MARMGFYPVRNVHVLFLLMVARPDMNIRTGVGTPVLRANCAKFYNSLSIIDVIML
mgnify:CR=1 FL=1